LPMHLTHRSLIDTHIISNMRIFVRGRVIAVFHVRHVDVDDAIEQSERFEAVVSASVVYKRKPQPTLRRNGYGCENLRHYMARGDQIDVMAAEGLQSQHHLSEFLIARLLALALPGNLPVLAVDAAQVASRKENRARTTPAAQTILFAVVWTGRIDDRSFTGAADRAVNRPYSIDAAIAGAEIAIFHMVTGSASAVGQLA